MADVDPNLVRLIAEQVMAALRGGGVAMGGVGNAPVSVHAPIGQCTGDYSKFPELQGLISAAGPTNAPVAAPMSAAPTPAPVAPTPPAPVVTALKGVITVSHLRGLKGQIRLAKGAILSPLAMDYVRDKQLNIMTDDGALGVRVNGGAAPTTGNGQTFWWIEGQCPSVAKVIDALRPNILASREPGNPASLRTVVKELAGLVKNKRVSGGLLFVPSAARAVCYANRCSSLRAIVGTNDKAVSDGIDLLGANVLVLEYPQFGFKSMFAMVKPFVESLQTAPGVVQKELDELRMCG